MATTDQPKQALLRAQEVKGEMFQLRQRIRAGGSEHGPEIAGRVILDGSSPMSFEKLLRAVPDIGRIKAEKMLRKARIHPLDRVDSSRVDINRRMLLVDLLLRRS
jgi:hypothetical protein